MIVSVKSSVDDWWLFWIPYDYSSRLSPKWVSLCQYHFLHRLQIIQSDVVWDNTLLLLLLCTWLQCTEDNLLLQGQVDNGNSSQAFEFITLKERFFLLGQFHFWTNGSHCWDRGASLFQQWWMASREWNFRRFEWVVSRTVSSQEVNITRTGRVGWTHNSWLPMKQVIRSKCCRTIWR